MKIIVQHISMKIVFFPISAGDIVHFIESFLLSSIRWEWRMLNFTSLKHSENSRQNKIHIYRDD